MNFNKTVFKRCIGSLALISAFTFSMNALAEDQTYTCTYRQSVKYAGAGASGPVTKDIQAASTDDARSKIEAKLKNSERAISTVSCELKN